MRGEDHIPWNDSARETTTASGMMTRQNFDRSVPDRSSLVASIRERLFTSWFDRPQLLAQSVTDTLVELLDLEAASFYLNVPALSGSKLKAVTGFDYADYASIILPNPSYVGQAIATNATIVANYPFDAELYRDSALLTDRHIRHLVCVPFSSANTQLPYPPTLGAICLYVAKPSQLELVKLVAESVVNWLSLLYEAAADNTFMQVRRRVVHETAFENSLSVVGERVLAILQEVLGFEFGAVWLLDTRREQLIERSRVPARVEASTAGPTSVDLRDGDDPVVQAFLKEGLTKWSHSGYVGEDHMTPEMAKLARDLYNGQGDAENLAMIPIRPAKEVTLGHHKRSSLGVLLIGNNYSELGSRRIKHSMAWDDIQLVSFVIEMTAVLVFQTLQNMDHEADYERRIHGLKAGLGAVAAHLDALETRERIGEIVQARHKYYLSNCRVWIEEMLNQVGAAEAIEHRTLAIRPTLLYAGIITKATANAKNMARAAGISSFRVGGESRIASSARSIPPVLADSGAMLTVFRNLFENSLKYQTDDHVEVEISVHTHYLNGRYFVELSFEDNGIGIPPRLRERVFEEGYRSSLAKQVHGSGHGIGLYQCRQLMEGMGGSIDCVEPERLGGARFILLLEAN